ncbi:MAG: hypothetical protein ISN28_03230 [Ectothiorhodospiraceae bacterium AqS1]|nr:hypothetical protein [Ectothiorhodospiraceae bacterium AqS1]
MPIAKRPGGRRRTIPSNPAVLRASPPRFAGLIGSLIVALLVSGCGYSLGGFDADRGLDIEAMRVSGPEAIRGEVVEILEGIGVATQSAAQAATGAASQNPLPHLQILDERCHRENLITDVGSGKERDFAVVCRLRFRLIGSAGDAIIASQNMNLRRESRHDPQRLIAGEWEESMLREDIRREAAARIVRRVQAAQAKMRAQDEGSA